MKEQIIHTLIHYYGYPHPKRILDTYSEEDLSDYLHTVRELAAEGLSLW